jgi:hypothetical protein
MHGGSGIWLAAMFGGQPESLAVRGMRRTDHLSLRFVTLRSLKP